MLYRAMVELQDIFGIWPTLAEMARDLDLPYERVAKWAQRERIPSDAWEAVINAVKGRGGHITFEQLARANPPRQSAGA
jgi:cell division FtsZ-interacting protein ZapD